MQLFRGATFRRGSRYIIQLDVMEPQSWRRREPDQRWSGLDWICGLVVRVLMTSLASYGANGSGWVRIIRVFELKGAGPRDDQIQRKGGNAPCCRGMIIVVEGGKHE